MTFSKKLFYWMDATTFLIASGASFKLAINPIGRHFALVIGILFLGPSLYLFGLPLRSRLILDGSRIEVRHVFAEFTADRTTLKASER